MDEFKLGHALMSRPSHGDLCHDVEGGGGLGGMPGPGDACFVRVCVAVALTAGLCG